MATARTILALVSVGNVPLTWLCSRDRALLQKSKALEVSETCSVRLPNTSPLRIDECVSWIINVLCTSQRTVLSVSAVLSDLVLYCSVFVVRPNPASNAALCCRMGVDLPAVDMALATLCLPVPT